MRATLEVSDDPSQVAEMVFHGSTENRITLVCLILQTRFCFAPWPFLLKVSMSVFSVLTVVTFPFTLLAKYLIYLLYVCEIKLPLPKKYLILRRQYRQT